MTLRRPWQGLSEACVSSVMLTVYENYQTGNWSSQNSQLGKWDIAAQLFRPHYEECFPLHVAVMEADSQKVEDLLACGADMNAKDCLGNSAYSNIDWGREEAESIALLLLDHGAKPDPASPRGRAHAFAQSYQRRAALMNKFGNKEEELAPDRPVI